MNDPLQISLIPLPAEQPTAAQRVIGKVADLADTARHAKEQTLIDKGLPAWPEKARGVPNGVLRSSLFRVAKKGNRDYLRRQKIASVDGLIVIFNGPRLCQFHLDVWENCLHIARSRGTGQIIRFTAYSFLKAIGRNTGKSDREWLKGVLLDLASSVVEITDGKKTYFGQILHHGIRDEVTKEYLIEINPRLALLYGADGWSRIEWEQRLALKGQPLAQWLHGFYSSHAKPYPYKVETVKELCGSDTRELFHFRAELRQALMTLTSITGWLWKIDTGDLLHLFKRPRAGDSSQGVGG